jgi:hypothetical protein
MTMLICIGFYKRKPGLSVEEFHRLWSGEYGPLYSAIPEVKRYIRRYVQHRLDNSEFDGFSESWYDSAVDREAMKAEPIYLEKIDPLVATFLDMEGSKFGVTDSQTFQVGGPPELVRAVTPKPA